MLRVICLASCAAAVLGFAPPAGSRMVAQARRVASHSAPLRMDETLFDDILSDELEKEGAEKPWLSEAGWAVYLDSQNQGYAMNEKVSEADKYFTASVFGNPFEVIGDFFDGLDGITEKMFPLSKKYDAPPPAKKEKSKGGGREVGKPGFMNLFGAGPTEM